MLYLPWYRFRFYFLLNWGNLAGDWALEPQGALTFIGTEGTLVTECVFERLDGNAVFIGGYNRHVAVRDSHFLFIGNNAVALWGNTECVSLGYSSYPSLSPLPSLSLSSYPLLLQRGVYPRA